jgi:DNA/RNA endonuclease G (NUC1)
LRLALVILTALCAFAGDVFYGGVQPRTLEPVTVVAYTAYTVGYSETRKVPLWSVYCVTGPQEDPGPVSRKGMPFFTERATQAQVTTLDYARSGYSRGHMTPFAAIAYAFGADPSRQTFSMANMVPQLQQHNAGIWSRLEEAVSGRRAGGGFQPGLTGRSAQIWVYTGPVLAPEGATISAKGIAIPTALWKAAIWITREGGTRACAWIVPHVEGLDPQAYMSYATTMARIRDEAGVELLTGDPADLMDRCDAAEVEP